MGREIASRNCDGNLVLYLGQNHAICVNEQDAQRQTEKLQQALNAEHDKAASASDTAAVITSKSAILSTRLANAEQQLTDVRLNLSAQASCNSSFLSVA